MPLFRRPRTPAPLPGRFALQRFDLVWFADWPAGCEPVWDPAPAQARVFPDLDEALAQQKALRKAGHVTTVVAVK